MLNWGFFSGVLFLKSWRGDGVNMFLCISAGKALILLSKCFRGWLVYSFLSAFLSLLVFELYLRRATAVPFFSISVKFLIWLTGNKVEGKKLIVPLLTDFDGLLFLLVASFFESSSLSIHNDFFHILRLDGWENAEEKVSLWKLGLVLRNVRQVFGG